MKIYTVSKKPKLYNLLILTLIIILVAGLLYFSPIKLPGGKLIYVNVLITAFLASSLTILVVSLIRQLKYNPYSYNTVYYFSFSLFVLSVLLTHIYSLIKTFFSADIYDTRFMFATFKNATSFYIMISVPFFVVFSLGLIISNIVLIKKEGISLNNILGIVLAVLVLGSDILLLIYKFGIRTELIVIDVFFEIFFYFECMMIGTIFADIFAALHVPEYNKDYIIILGCRVGKDGSPTPLLKSRIDRALRFAEKQEEESGKIPSFIASGGQGSDEVVSEASSIGEYLKSRGIPEDRIILEDQSTSTLENMAFSLKKVPEDAKLAFSTTNYHVFRSGIAANRARKFSAEGMGAPTKWYYWPNAAVREFVGLITAHIGKQILVFLGVMFLYFAFLFFGKMFV